MSSGDVNRMTFTTQSHLLRLNMTPVTITPKSELFHADRRQNASTPRAGLNSAMSSTGLINSAGKSNSNTDIDSVDPSAYRTRCQRSGANRLRSSKLVTVSPGQHISNVEVHLYPRSFSSSSSALCSCTNIEHDQTACSEVQPHSHFHPPKKEGCVTETADCDSVCQSVCDMRHLKDKQFCRQPNVCVSVTSSGQHVTSSDPKGHVSVAEQSPSAVLNQHGSDNRRTAPKQRIARVELQQQSQCLDDGVTNCTALSTPPIASAGKHCDSEGHTTPKNTNKCVRFTHNLSIDSESEQQTTREIPANASCVTATSQQSCDSTCLRQSERVPSTRVRALSSSAQMSPAPVCRAPDSAAPSHRGFAPVSVVSADRAPNGSRPVLSLPGLVSGPAAPAPPSPVPSRVAYSSASSGRASGIAPTSGGPDPSRNVAIFDLSPAHARRSISPSCASADRATELAPLSVASGSAPAISALRRTSAVVPASVAPWPSLDRAISSSAPAPSLAYYTSAFARASAASSPASAPRRKWKDLAEVMKSYRQGVQRVSKADAGSWGSFEDGVQRDSPQRLVKIVLSNVCYQLPLRIDLPEREEHLFDVSDLQHEPPLISKCGSLEVSFTYEACRGKMTVHVHRARELPTKDRGGANSTQVRLMLLPTKKQRFKTKVKDGGEPVYDETFVFTKITTDEIPGMGVRFRLYGQERMRREYMIGESIIGFAALNLLEPSTFWIILEPRSNLSHGDSGSDVCSLSRSESASSMQSLQHGGMPELLVGLAYNETTGRLAVQVIKGSNFRNMATNRPPDTYVKLTLLSPTGQEVQQCKTSIRRGQPNPLFKETFMMQVPHFQLPDVTLMVSVYNKKSMKKKEMIGWISLGQNTSGEEETAHWMDMRESKGEEVCRWHELLES